MINHTFIASGRNLGLALLTGAVLSGLSACKDDDTNYLLNREEYETKMTLTLDIVDDEASHPVDVIYQPESRAGNRQPALLPAVPDGYALHYVVAATKGDGLLWSRATSDSPEVTMSLTPGDYTVYAWADFVPKDGGRADRDHWYFTDEFNEVLLKEKFSYKGSTHAKKAFAGSKKINVPMVTERADAGSRSADERITLSTPQGRFRVLPTKEAPYEVGSVKITYKEGIWGGHDLIGDAPTVRWQGVNFHTIYGSCADDVLGFDYLFTGGGEDETFPMMIEVFDGEGYLRARAADVKVPLRRGHLTTVRGDFFNILEKDPTPADTTGGNGGGIGIDPEFEKTFIISITK